MRAAAQASAASSRPPFLVFVMCGALCDIDGVMMQRQRVVSSKQSRGAQSPMPSIITHYCIYQHHPSVLPVSKSRLCCPF
jgi:ribose/xylose/arabinose/galactoside ABC-type transport system permease subunit